MKINPQVYDVRNQSIFEKFTNTKILEKLTFLFCEVNTKYTMETASTLIKYTYFFKQLVSGLSPLSCKFFKFFLAQSCLMVAYQFNQVTYVCEEYSNFQDSKSLFIFFLIFGCPMANFWVILEGTALLTRCQSLRFLLF